MILIKQSNPARITKRFQPYFYKFPIRKIINTPDLNRMAGKFCHFTASDEKYPALLT